MKATIQTFCDNTEWTFSFQRVMCEATLLLCSPVLSDFYDWHFYLDITVTLISPCLKPYFHFLHACILFLTFPLLFWSHCPHDFISTCLNHINRLSSEGFSITWLFSMHCAYQIQIHLLRQHVFLKILFKNLQWHPLPIR